MNTIPNHEKLLSHRARGFAKYEHTRSAFGNACQSSVSYVEIDTRVSVDGAIFVYHDPVAAKIVEPGFRFQDVPSSYIQSARFLDGEPLMFLSDALDIFSERSYSNQVLCIDIKDFGYEEAHLRLVRERGLESNVIFVSWIPQSLLRLYELGSRSRLILSHWNLLRFGLIGRLASAALSRRLQPLAHFVIIGRELYGASLGNLGHGYQHGYLCCNLPSQLASILAGTGGGVCVHLSVLSPTLIEYCQEKRLSVWVFSVADRQSFDRVAAVDGVDVVFCDDVPKVLGLTSYMQSCHMNHEKS